MVKKDFTSFDLHAVVSELRDKLADSRVNNVYQLDAKTLMLKLHKANEPPMRLVLEAGRRIHLTAYSLEKPQEPPPFAMAMRKYLPGGWLVNFEQLEFERVAVLHFKTKLGMLKLVVELFGEGNIVLTSEKGEILQALFFKRMRDRNIIRNEVYQLPPTTSKNPFKITLEEFTSGLNSSGEVELVRALVRLLGIGGMYSEELLQRANVEKTKRSNTLSTLEAEVIFGTLQELLSTVSTRKLEPNIVLDEKGGFVDVVPFRLKRYSTFNQTAFHSFSEALDEFYVRITAAEKAVAGIDITQVKREADRLRRMIADQEQAMREDDAKMVREKQIGDVIYAHFTELQVLLEKFSSKYREGKDLAEAVLDVTIAKQANDSSSKYYVSFDSKNLAVNVSVDNLLFSLNLRMTLYENANEFYDLGKRAKQKMQGVATALEESRKKLADLEKRVSRVEALKSAAPAEALEELDSRRVEIKEWFEKFRWFTSTEGFLVVAGKDVVSNEVLIKKHTDASDFVFHAEIVGAPFAVVKSEGKEPSDKTLKEAAEFAASLSRGWREKMGSVDVYWVKPNQLGKSGPSGEFVPHGAFAVSGKRNWMRGTILRLAIGIVESQEKLRFIGGPVDAVSAIAKVYVVLVPGDLSGKDLLKQTLRSLTLKLPKDQRDKLAKTSIESIREYIPYTTGRIVVNA
ncbi:MAG TPA: ribosome rescue protein RqcH [Candidatus Nanoarchaeia archaeon]|nr:ribosome rescue protein RqcH [Candidatus Nanoarchaeia archaeon]